MNYMADFHWIWYGIGFVCAPRLTIMIMLSLHFSNFIPLPLMVIGWIVAVMPKINFSN